MDRPQLADFLRRAVRRCSPRTSGSLPGARRRTKGLRREEVAMLAHMSTDYYAPARAAARAAAVRADARRARARAAADAWMSATTCSAWRARRRRRAARRTEHVNPALMRVLDRLDTPAQVVSDLGETLVQNQLAVALVGDRPATPAWRALGLPLVHRSRPSARSTRPTTTTRTVAPHVGEPARVLGRGPRPARARRWSRAAAAQPGVRRAVGRARDRGPTSASASASCTPGSDCWSCGARYLINADEGQVLRLHRRAGDRGRRQVAPARTGEPGIDAPFLERPRETKLLACPTLTFLT